MASVNKWVCIIPTNRPEEFVKFYTAWQPIFDKHEVKVVVMVDLEEVPPAIAELPVNVLCWKDLTTKYIPTKTDMIRSFAFHWAYEQYPDVKYFCTLDDDVRPIDFKRPDVGDLFEEYEKVFVEGEHLSEYFSVASMTTTPMRTEMRGYPYKDRVVRPVAVQYGGWWGTLDYDAATQLSEPRGPQQFALQTMPVPKGAACTCCIMNCAWQREYTPIMWQFPMLDGRYNRVGDIWSGLLIKKTLDAIGAVMVINGKASVLHERASNPYNSLMKEAPSVLLNDELWTNIRYAPFIGDDTMVGAYIGSLYSAQAFFIRHDKEYADHFKCAFIEWLELFE